MMPFSFRIKDYTKKNIFMPRKRLSRMNIRPKCQTGDGLFFALLSRASFLPVCSNFGFAQCTKRRKKRRGGEEAPKCHERSRPIGKVDPPRIFSLKEYLTTEDREGPKVPDHLNLFPRTISSLLSSVALVMLGPSNQRPLDHPSIL